MEREIIFKEIILSDIPTIIDVGSYDGNSSCDILKIFPNASIYAFEIDERSIELFKKNPKTKDIVLTTAAVSNVDGEIKFYRSDSETRRHNNNEDSWSASSSTVKPSCPFIPVINAFFILIFFIIFYNFVFFNSTLPKLPKKSKIAISSNNGNSFNIFFKVKEPSYNSISENSMCKYLTLLFNVFTAPSMKFFSPPFTSTQAKSITSSGVSLIQVSNFIEGTVTES